VEIDLESCEVLSVTEAPENIDYEDVAWLGEREFGVTSPKRDRPVLRTRGVGHGHGYCTGFALYDRNRDVGAMAHVHSSGNDVFDERLNDVIDGMGVSSDSELDFVYIGEIIVNETRDDIEQFLEKIDDEDKLSSVSRIDDLKCVLDTRNRKFYTESDHLLSYDESWRDRPYGSNRYDPETGLPRWSQAYPDPSDESDL
jgi:hypothetical protein